MRLGYWRERVQTQTLSGPHIYSAEVHVLVYKIHIVSMKVSYSLALVEQPNTNLRGPSPSWLLTYWNNRPSDCMFKWCRGSWLLSESVKMHFKERLEFKEMRLKHIGVCCCCSNAHVTHITVLHMDLWVHAATGPSVVLMTVACARASIPQVAGHTNRMC